MWDINSIRDIIKKNISIFDVGEVTTDLLGTEVTLKNVLLETAEQNIIFTPEIFAHDTPGVDCENFYQVWIHESTNEFDVDYSNPIPFKESMRWPLGFAVLIYFQDHAAGIRQNAFLHTYRDRVIEQANLWVTK